MSGMALNSIGNSVIKRVRQPPVNRLAQYPRGLSW